MGLDRCNDHFFSEIDPKLGNGIETFIIDYLCLPSLHLVLGSFNKLWKELEIVEPRINDVALELNCVREEYFGKKFEGNETNKLLKNTDKLREVTDESLHIFIECMGSTVLTLSGDNLTRHTFHSRDVCHCITATVQYSTVRVTTPEPTRRRTAPYESPYDDI